MRAARAFGGFILRRTITLVVVVVLAGAATVYLFRDSDGAGGTSVTTPTVAPSQETGPDVAPADSAPPGTEAPVAVPSAGSRRTAPDTGETATSEPGGTPDGGASADVTLSYVQWNEETSAVEASGYVVPLEEGGTCWLTLTRASVTATSEEVDALPDVSSVACGALQVSGDELSSGLWRAVLSYESATASGTSAAREVTVP